MICEVVVAKTKPADMSQVIPDLVNVRFAYPPGCVFASGYTKFIPAKQDPPRVSRLSFKREETGEVIRDDNYVVVEIGRDDFLVLPRELWKRITELISIYLSEGTLRGGIILYGVPGTGKSHIATKLMPSILGLDVVVKKSTDFMSRYVGEPYQMLNKFINENIKTYRPSIVVFDEGERLLLRRGSGGGLGDSVEKQIEDNMKNILLTTLQEMMDVGYPVILIVTTNISINELDEAMLRRFPWKIYFPPYSHVVYEYIARRTTQKREFEIDGVKYDIPKLAYYASATGISVAEFRNMISLGTVSFLRNKTSFPRRLVPYEIQDEKKIFDISTYFKAYNVQNSGASNVKMVVDGALYTMTAVVASYFVTKERRPVYLIDMPEKTTSYGSDDVISLLKQENKPVGIIHLHSTLNTYKLLLVERLLEEEGINFVVITSFQPDMMPIHTIKLMPRFSVPSLKYIDLNSLEKLVYTVRSFYGMKFDETKMVNELYRKGDFLQAVDVLEKIVIENI